MILDMLILLEAVIFSR